MSKFVAGDAGSRFRPLPTLYRFLAALYGIGLLLGTGGVIAAAFLKTDGLFFRTEAFRTVSFGLDCAMGVGYLVSLPAFLRLGLRSCVFLALLALAQCVLFEGIILPCLAERLPGATSSSVMAKVLALSYRKTVKASYLDLTFTLAGEDGADQVEYSCHDNLYCGSRWPFKGLGRLPVQGETLKFTIRGNFLGRSISAILPP